MGYLDEEGVYQLEPFEIEEGDQSALVNRLGRTLASGQGAVAPT